MVGSSKVERTLVEGLVGTGAQAAVAAAGDVGAPGGVADADQPVRTVNVLLVGSDSREGLTAEQIDAFGTGEAAGDQVRRDGESLHRRTARLPLSRFLAWIAANRLRRRPFARGRDTPR